MLRGLLTFRKCLAWYLIKLLFPYKRLRRLIRIWTEVPPGLLRLGMYADIDVSAYSTYLRRFSHLYGSQYSRARVYHVGSYHKKVGLSRGLEAEK